MRVPDTDWSLIVNIPAAILEKQNKNFISMALIMLGTNIFLLLCLLVYFYRVRLSAVNEKTQLKEKEDFLSRIRHEIRTPLNGLIGLHYLMQNHIGDAKQMEEYVQKSVHSIRYLQTVINDMLDFSQLTQDKLVLEKSPFSLDHTLSALDSLIRIQTEEKRLRFMLEGHRVSWAANGKQTVDLFAASGTDEFDLILMDLQMPVMDGYEAARQIRAMDRPDAKTVSIWACTANTFQEDQKSAQACGMNGFISKPINVKQLLKRLQENS